jgi:hypothetical protein
VALEPVVVAVAQQAMPVLAVPVLAVPVLAAVAALRGARSCR